MSFIRSLSATQTEKLQYGQNAELFARLKADVLSGDEKDSVFPAVRKNELHFYYKGGCLYKFKNGSFHRNADFEKYSADTDGLAPYEKAKKQNENKFTNAHGTSAERQLLDRLNRHTFDCNRKTHVVVLDIEVNLNGECGGGKKCDTVLFDTQSGELMFVEGKVFSDRRVNVSVGKLPEVISQVNTYTAAIGEQRREIVRQYGEHVRIVNELFGSALPQPKSVIIPAKLLVYSTPRLPTVANAYSIATINEYLGRDNVAWIPCGDQPTAEEIRRALCK